MGVQHTFGGVSRGAFPILAGFLMDHAGIGVPFWLSAILVLVTLPLTATLAKYVLDKNRTTGGDGLASALDEITGEFPAATG
jgi:MFS family permease